MLDPAFLGRYISIYLIGTDTLHLSAEKGKRALTAPGNTKINLEAATEKDFYLKVVLLNIHFKNDNAGKISGFQLVQFDGDTLVKKLIEAIMAYFLRDKKNGY